MIEHNKSQVSIFLEFAQGDPLAAEKLLHNFGVERFRDLTSGQADVLITQISAPRVSDTEAQHIRQAPLPKANDPYEWTGWPLFEQYGVAGDCKSSKRWTRTVSLPLEG